MTIDRISLSAGHRILDILAASEPKKGDCHGLSPFTLDRSPSCDFEPSILQSDEWLLRPVPEPYLHGRNQQVMDQSEKFSLLCLERTRWIAEPMYRL